jgi:DNA-binding MarR family transcriptional regulator
MDDFKSFLKENQQKLKIESAIDRHLNDYSSDLSKGKKLRPMKRKYPRKNKNEGKVIVVTNNREYDFLKYYFLVKTWASVRYGLRYEEIEFLMYFYSETHFSNKDFDIYARAILNKKKNISRFVDMGLIEMLPGQEEVVKRTNRCYRLTHKCKRVIMSIYKKLVLEESIDENPMNNPLFLNHSTSYKDKRIRELIKDMNYRRSKLMSGDTLNYLPDDIKKKEGY